MDLNRVSILATKLRSASLIMDRADLVNLCRSVANDLDYLLDLEHRPRSIKPEVPESKSNKD